MRKSINFTLQTATISSSCSPYLGKSNAHIYGSVQVYLQITYIKKYKEDGLFLRQHYVSLIKME